MWSVGVDGGEMDCVGETSNEVKLVRVEFKIAYYEVLIF